MSTNGNSKDHSSKAHVDDFLNSLVSEEDQLAAALHRLAQLCPQTFEPSALETEEDFEKNFETVAASLPTTSPLLARVGGEMVTIGEVRLNWREIYQALLRDRDVMQKTMVNLGCSEEEASVITRIMMIARASAVMFKTKVRMSNAFGLLLDETCADGAGMFGALNGLPPLPDGPLVDHLTSDFRQSIRRIRESKTGRPKDISWVTWQRIEKAILAWPRRSRPTLAVFELTLNPRKLEVKNPTEHQAEMKRAKDRLKAKLRKLHLEAFCPTADWLELWAHVRSPHYNPRVFNPLAIRIDADLGDQEH